MGVGPRKQGPKAKARMAKAEAKKSARSKALGTSSKVALVSEPIEGEPGSSNDEKSGKGWSLQRDLDRIIKSMLSFIDPLDVQSRRNGDGHSVRQYLEAALLANQGKNKSSGKREYLTAAFWAEFFESFGFKNPGFHGLREEVTLDDEYWEVMDVCNSENPTQRSEDPWCEYVSALKEISEPNLVALFHAAAHSRLVTLKMAYRMQLALAKLCGRLDVPNRDKATWTVVSDKLDSVLTWHWQQKEGQDSYVDRAIWVQTHHEAVFSMIPKADYEACEKASTEKGEIPADALQNVLKSHLGQALFYQEARQFQMKSFIDRCHKRAFDLLHNGFTEENVQEYHQAAAVECKNLIAGGQKMFDRSVKREVSFCGEMVQVFPTSVYDLKDWILYATARSMAISNGQLRRLPWEDVLWNGQPLERFGLTVQVPESLLAHGRNARVVISRIAGEWGPGRTLASMQADITKHQKDILETDRSAALEVAFMMQKAHVMADAWAKEEMHRTLQAASACQQTISKAEMMTCMTELKKVKSDRRFAFLPSVTAQDFDAVLSLISAMLEGGASGRMRTPPTGMSGFMQKSLDEMPNWLKLNVPVQKAKSKLQFATKALSGAEAAQHIFQALSRSEAHERSDEELLMLRSFQWLLGAHSRDQLDSWVEPLVRQTKASVVAAGMLTDGPSEENGASSSGVGSSSASATPAVNIAKRSIVEKLPGASSKKARGSTASVKDKMLKICCGKQ